MTEPTTNALRGARGQRILTTYAEMTGLGEENHTATVDLIADLFHLWGEYVLNIYIEAGRTHHTEDLEEETANQDAKDNAKRAERGRLTVDAYGENLSGSLGYEPDLERLTSAAYLLADMSHTVGEGTMDGLIEHARMHFTEEVLDAENSEVAEKRVMRAAEIAHRYLWGDDTEIIKYDDPRQPYSFFVERIVDAWDPDDRVDSAERLIGAIQTMIAEWEVTTS